MPPQWQIDYWKNEQHWVKRFVRGSWDLNMILCGLSDQVKDTIWTKKYINSFLCCRVTIFPFGG